MSISGWLFIKFNNAFAFLDPEAPNLSILCIDDLEYMATLNYVLYYFNLYNHQN